MSTSIKIAPPNSLLLVSDREGGTVPEITRERRLWFTPSCIAIGCLAFMDGETEVTLANTRDVHSDNEPAFDGVLETPSRTVIVWTVERKTLLEAAVDGRRTRVRVWTNHPMEPDKVAIGLG
jgi:hypothetical protein